MVKNSMDFARVIFAVYYQRFVDFPHSQLRKHLRDRPLNKAVKRTSVASSYIATPDILYWFSAGRVNGHKHPALDSIVAYTHV